MDEGQIRETLATFGNPVGAPFAQNKGTNHPALQPRVKGGMCQGLTLDWIRRVLLGGKAPETGNPFVADDSRNGRPSTNAAKNLRQYEKGAGLQVSSTNQEKKNAFSVALNEQLNARYKAKYENYKADVEAHLASWNNNTFDGTEDEHDTKTQALHAAFKTWDAEIDTPERTPESKRVRFWQHYCDRGDGSRVGKHEERRMSNLRVVAVTESKIYSGGLAEFLPIAIRAVNYNQAACVGINPPIADAVGHAVGMHRLSTGMFHLFEPNYGVYDMRPSKMCEALIFLFQTAYPESDGISDGKAYEVNGVVMGDYMIFEKK